ncbi:MAG: capsular biosynthesis protein, partial [Citromicrobium sp.]|nr:capsular biosynthesis protein [Citromicrobium sp.]
MPDATNRRFCAPILVTVLALALAGCSSFGAAGPSTREVRGASDAQYGQSDILVVDLDRPAAGRIADFSEQRSFANVFGGMSAAAPLIERGDTIAVTLWEAPPAVLFGGAGNARLSQDPMLSASTTLPDQRVDEDGAIAVPFAGRVQVAGRTPLEVQRDIVARLRGKANDPQAVVRLVDNQS